MLDRVSRTPGSLSTTSERHRSLEMVGYPEERLLLVTESPVHVGEGGERTRPQDRESRGDVEQTADLVDPEHHQDEPQQDERIRDELAEPDRGHADIWATECVHEHPRLDGQADEHGLEQLDRLRRRVVAPLL